MRERSREKYFYKQNGSENLARSFGFSNNNSEFEGYLKN